MSERTQTSRETESSRTVSTSINTQLSDSINTTDLLEKEIVLPFAGVTAGDSAIPPTSLSDGHSFHTDESRSFKQALSILPDATSGELFAQNQFVGEDGTPAVETIRAETSLDLDELAAYGVDIEQRSERFRGKLDPVAGHRDIRDPRREALSALGFDVEYRWQIASNRYSIIQPATILRRLVATLQQQGYTDVYGAISLRKWGGTADIFIIIPELAMDLEALLNDPDDIAGLVDAAEAASDSDSQVTPDELNIDTPATPDDPADQEVHPGLCINYSHTGTSLFKATDISFIPEEDTLTFSSTFEKRRRHDGSPTDAVHERNHDRTPLTEWWDEALTSLEAQRERFPQRVARARKTPLDFSAADYTVEEFYTYLGIPEKYAESAANIAQSLGVTPRFISLWSLHVALGSVLTTDFGGSFASQSHKGYLSVATKILSNPTTVLEEVKQGATLDAYDDSVNIARIPDAELPNIDTVTDIATLTEVKSPDNIENVTVDTTPESVNATIEEFL